MFNFLRKKHKEQGTIEVIQRIEIQEQEERHIGKDTKKILEELVMFFFEKYIKLQEVSTNLEDIIKKINLDDFLKNDQELKKIMEDIISMAEGKNIDKERIFDKLSNYHVKILKL